MICNSCGAKYDKEALRCPYCYSENGILAKKIRQDMLASYDTEAKEMEVTVPKQAVRMWTKQFIKVLPAIVIFAVVATVIAIFAGRISADREYNVKQANLQKMEELFAEEDWKALCEYYYGHDDVYSTEFEKYREMIQAYTWYEMFTETLDEIEDLETLEFDSDERKQELYLSWISTALSNVQQALSTCKSYSEDNSFRGNEKKLETIYQECADILSAYGCSKEEIEQLVTDKDAGYLEKLSEKMLIYYLK